MKRIITIGIISLIILVVLGAILFWTLYTYNNKWTYTYSSSGYESCDYSKEDLCIENECRWHLLTDTISVDRPIPATCCPKDVVPTPNPSDPDDPCQILHG